MRLPRSAVLMPSLLVASLALASEVDPTTLYKITTDGTTAKVAPGKKGTLVLEIQSLRGAHVSDEAPLRIQLSGSGGANAPRCLPKGMQCPPTWPPCCAGLQCVPASTRAFCE